MFEHPEDYFSDLNPFEIDIKKTYKKFKTLEKNSSVLFSEEEIRGLIFHFIIRHDVESLKRIIEHGLFLYPKNMSFHVSKISHFVETEQFDKALEAIKKAQLVDSNHPEVLKWLAEIQMENEDLDEAVITINKALLNCSEETLFLKNDLYISLADLYCNMKKHQKAILVLEKAISEIEENEVFYQEIIEIFSENDKLVHAVTYFKNRIDQNPYSYKDWFYLGDTHMKLKDFENAYEAFEYCSIIDANALYPFFLMATCKEFQNKYQEAIQLYIKSIRDSEDHYPYLCVARCYLDLNELDQAKLYLKKCKNNSLFEFQYNKLMGSILIEEGKIKSAIKFLQKSYDENPYEVETIQLLMNCYIDLNMREEFEEIFEEIQEDDELVTDYWKDWMVYFYQNEMIDKISEIATFAYECSEIDNKDVDNLQLVINFALTQKPRIKEVIIKNLIEDFDETHENLMLICPDLTSTDKEIQKAINYYNNSQDE